jgi:hypothetical protein
MVEPDQFSQSTKPNPFTFSSLVLVLLRLASAVAYRFRCVLVVLVVSIGHLRLALLRRVFLFNSFRVSRPRSLAPTLIRVSRLWCSLSFVFLLLVEMLSVDVLAIVRLRLVAV